MFYVRKDGKVSGPFEPAAIKKLAATGRISASDELSADGKNWKAAGLAKGIAFSQPEPESETKSVASPALIGGIAIGAILLIGAGLGAVLYIDSLPEAKETIAVSVAPPQATPTHVEPSIVAEPNDPAEEAQSQIEAAKLAEAQKLDEAENSEDKKRQEAVNLQQAEQLVKLRALHDAILNDKVFKAYKPVYAKEGSTISEAEDSLAEFSYPELKSAFKTMETYSQNVTEAIAAYEQLGGGAGEKEWPEVKAIYLNAAKAGRIVLESAKQIREDEIVTDLEMIGKSSHRSDETYYRLVFVDSDGIGDGMKSSGVAALFKRDSPIGSRYEYIKKQYLRAKAGFGN